MKETVLSYLFSSLPLLSLQKSLLDFSSEMLVKTDNSSKKKLRAGLIDRVEDFENGNGQSAAVYLRVSTRKQATDGYSLANQEEKAREVAKGLGLSRIYWLMDLGKPGWDFSKRKLDKALELAQDSRRNPK